MSKRQKTALGSPRAGTWNDSWFRRVDALEQESGRRICGAHAPDAQPCLLVADHPNGRCRFHGGHPRVGAQKGNKNALIHGLYARRLRQCSDQCPIWHACAFAGQDVLDLPEPKRLICAYEQAAMDHIQPPPPAPAAAPVQPGDDKASAARDSEQSESEPEPSPSPKNPSHRIVDDAAALLYVMLNRAATVLSVTGLTEEVSATGDHYTMQSTKVSAPLQAFIRIARELRAYVRLSEILEPPDATSGEDEPLSLPMYFKPLMEKAEKTGFLARLNYYDRHHKARLHRRKKRLGIHDPGDPVNVPMP